MRDRNLLYLFLGLNVALAGAFVTYLFLSSNGQPKIVATSFPGNAKTNLIVPSTNVAKLATNRSATVTPTTNVVLLAGPTQATNSAAAQPVFTQKKFGWREVESAEYVAYMNSLRAVGCPEEKVRDIVMGDVNELFQQQKLKIALENDQPWWKMHSEYQLVNIMQQRGQALEESRQALVDKLFGYDAIEKQRVEPLLWNSVQLTGPVLGNLAPQLHNQVQEICAESIQRQQSYYWDRANQGQPLNNVETANLREQTRSELRKVLNPQEIEEFVLRYSYDAAQLREELRGIDPTAEEFRKVFRATDPLDHQMLLEFGGVEAMSEKQRERYEKDRLAAVREALGPERYQAYLLIKDPLYREAQMMALNYGAPKAIIPIYQMAKVNETKRQKILKDPTLTPQQKNEALAVLNSERQRSVQQLINQAAAQR